MLHKELITCYAYRMTNTEREAVAAFLIDQYGRAQMSDDLISLMISEMSSEEIASIVANAKYTNAVIKENDTVQRWYAVGSACPIGTVKHLMQGKALVSFDGTWPVWLSVNDLVHYTAK